MMVLGIRTRDTYICEVSHQELEKVFDKYYGDFPRLESGQTLDLGMAHDFYREIQNACKRMVEASKAFEPAQKAIFNFSQMVTDRANRS